METKVTLLFKSKEEALKVLNLRESYVLGEKVSIQGNGVKIKLKDTEDVYIDQPFSIERENVSSNYLFKYSADVIINAPSTERLKEVLSGRRYEFIENDIIETRETYNKL